MEGNLDQTSQPYERYHQGFDWLALYTDDKQTRAILKAHSRKGQAGRPQLGTQEYDYQPPWPDYDYL